MIICIIHHTIRVAIKSGRKTLFKKKRVVEKEANKIGYGGCHFLPFIGWVPLWRERESEVGSGCFLKESISQK